MRLKTWLGVFSFFVASCTHLPPRPSGELCTLDWQRQQAICAPFGIVKSLDDLKEPQLSSVIRKNATSIKPLSECDKYVMFSPSSWESVQNYMDKLRNYAELYCKPGK